MFRGINLFGAEINANFSEQHHAHLFLSNKFLSISIFALFVKLEWVSFPIGVGIASHCKASKNGVIGYSK